MRIMVRPLSSNSPPTTTATSHLGPGEELSGTPGVKGVRPAPQPQWVSSGWPQPVLRSGTFSFNPPALWPNNIVKGPPTP